jgi:hypothetical protein
MATHTAADIDFLEAHGFTYEYPGFFVAQLTAALFLSCAFDWSGTGKWELQLQSHDGHAPDDEFDDAEDFDTREEVVMLRDLLLLGGAV